MEFIKNKIVAGLIARNNWQGDLASSLANETYTKTKITRFFNNPEREGTLDLLLHIKRLSGVRAIELIREIRAGYNNITLAQIETLEEEQRA